MTPSPYAWFLSGNARQNYLGQLSRQAAAYSPATYSNGIAILRRVIVFSSRVPAGMEQKWADIQEIVAANSDRLSVSPDGLERFKVNRSRFGRERATPLRSPS